MLRYVLVCVAMLIVPVEGSCCCFGGGEDPEEQGEKKAQRARGERRASGAVAASGGVSNPLSSESAKVDARIQYVDMLANLQSLGESIRESLNVELQASRLFCLQLMAQSTLDQFLDRMAAAVESETCMRLHGQDDLVGFEGVSIHNFLTGAIPRLLIVKGVKTLEGIKYLESLLQTLQDADIAIVCVMSMAEGVTLHSLLEDNEALMSSIDAVLRRSDLIIGTEMYPGSVSGLEPSRPVSVIRPEGQLRQGRIFDQNG